MLEELRKQIAKAENSVEKLRSLVKRYERERLSVKARLDYYDQRLEEELSTADQQAEGAAKEVGTEVLINNALLAIENTKEFDLPDFKQRLVEAIKDSRTITFTGTSWDIIVNINLDVTAGTLDDYIAGVELARKSLGLGSTRGKIHRATGEELASRIWKEKIYGAGREGKSVIKNRKRLGDIDLSSKYAEQYALTIQERLNSFSTTAPWWYIVNYGTPDTGGVGFPYPAFSGQRFVENSIQDIKNAYYRYRNAFRDEIRNLYNNLIRDAVEIIDNIDSDINYILKLIEDLTSFNIESDVNAAINAIYNRIERLGKRIEDADPKKVLETAYKLAESISIGTSRERVTLGVGIRIGTIELRRDYEGALAERINQ